MRKGLIVPTHVSHAIFITQQSLDSRLTNGITGPM
jgi:hypothetical protein